MPGLQIGYEHTFVHQVADFLDNLAKGKPTAPTFRDALATQAVCDAVLDSAEHQQVGIGRAGVRRLPCRHELDLRTRTHYIGAAML